MFYKSRRINFIIKNILIFYLLLTVFKICFFVFFNSASENYTFMMLCKGLYIGIKFDLRLSILLSFPVMISCLLPNINIIKSIRMRRIIMTYNYIIMAILLLFQSIDLGHYSYLGRRIDVSVLRFLDNPKISAQMIWESYPVLLIFIFLFVFFIGLKYLFELSFLILFKNQHVLKMKQKIFGITIFGFIILFSLWGTLKQYPLRWSDAFFSNNSFISALGLNPVLYYNDTRRFAKDDFNEKNARKYFPKLSEYLTINNPDPQMLNYGRFIERKEGSPKQPNIIIIFLESVGANRLSALGNPLNATPNIDKMIENGILFSRFYVPMVGTARSVFTMITGIPDVARTKTSSRNPRINKQYSIISDFKNYEKHYIMGGSAGWANIRGFLQLNIPDLTITEMDDLDSPRLDVWGVSDHNLFKESHQIFENIDKEKPFLAFIQTATNHRPYSIPNDIKGFEIHNISKQEATRSGFNSVDQYNAMRLLDHAIGEYISYAQNSEYYENTIFFLFGDHGTSDPWAEHMPLSDYELLLRSYHVPFIIFGSPLKESGLIREDVSMLPDLMPTIAGFAGINYYNQTLGRDLMNLRENQESFALTVGKKHAFPTIGIIGPQYYLTMYHDGTNINLYDLNEPGTPMNLKDNYPELSQRYSNLVQALYETSKYMLYNNSELIKP